MTPRTVAGDLDREHREIDEGIVAFTESGDTERLRAAVAALRRHIYIEEEVLFPPLQDAGLMAPVFVMLREHAQIWRTLDALEAQVDAGRTAADPATAALCRELTVQLQHHNPKEERILYPEADRLLPAAVRTEVAALVDAGELPKGWVCVRAR